MERSAVPGTGTQLGSVLPCARAYPVPGKRLTLVVRPDGRAILTSTEPLDDVEARILIEAFEGWEQGQALILANCDVVSVTEVTLDVKTEKV